VSKVEGSGDKGRGKSEAAGVKAIKPIVKASKSTSTTKASSEPKKSVDTDVQESRQPRRSPKPSAKVRWELLVSSTVHLSETQREKLNKDKGKSGNKSSKLKRTDKDIKGAVNYWLFDKKDAEANFGHISLWDPSAVTNFNGLFSRSVYDDDDDDENTEEEDPENEDYENTFNEDLSRWDVSSGKNFSFMFCGASSFNSDLSSWSVGKSVDFSHMFYKATSFNSDLCSWNVSNSMDFSSMFSDATSFYSDLSLWNVSKCIDFSGMFWCANSFNSDLNAWSVSSCANFKGMFMFASSFKSNLESWDTSKGEDFSYMFKEAKAFSSDVSSWNLISDADLTDMFRGATAFINGSYFGICRQKFKLDKYID
jgi:hypothetical protein